MAATHHLSDNCTCYFVFTKSKQTVYFLDQYIKMMKRKWRLKISRPMFRYKWKNMACSHYM